MNVCAFPEREDTVQTTNKSRSGRVADLRLDLNFSNVGMGWRCSIASHTNCCVALGTGKR